VRFLGVDEQEGYVFAVLGLQFLEVAKLGDTGRSRVASKLYESPAPQEVTQVYFFAGFVLQVHEWSGLTNGEFGLLVELSERVAAPALCFDRRDDPKQHQSGWLRRLA